MSKLKSVSVVIPNYNGETLLKENLPSVYKALAKAHIDYEIIIADDASTDHSINFLKTNYPDIKIVEAEHNKGFAPTINSGIFAAGKELVLLLNSDVLLLEDYLIPLFRYFTKEDTFGVMGRIIDMKGDRIQDGAKKPQMTGIKIAAIQNIIPENTNEQWFPSFYLSGANALIDREKLLQLGGFDEIFAPFYGEDLDLSLRAWKVGWKCYYEHKAVCRHPLSITINKYNKWSKIKRVSYRNRFIFHAIHLEGSDRILWNTWVYLQLAGKSIFFKKQFVAAFREFLKLENEIKKSRESLQKLKQLNPRSLTLKQIYKYFKAQYQALPYRNI